MESWMVKQIEQHGVDWTKAQIMQLMTKAEGRAIQQRQQTWSQVAQNGEGRRVQPRPSEEAKQKYAERRRVRRAQQAAQVARQKAAAAMEAVRKGEYPTPWASLTEAQAKAKEATAQQRAALQQQRAARQVQQQQHAQWKALEGRQRDAKVAEERRHRMQTQGLAKHKEIDAEVQQRSAEASLQAAQQQAKQARLQLTQQHKQRQVKAVKWHRMVDTMVTKLKAARKIWAARWAAENITKNRTHLQEHAPEYSFDLSLNSPCLRIPCLANQCLTEQA